MSLYIISFSLSHMRLLEMAIVLEGRPCKSRLAWLQNLHKPHSRIFFAGIQATGSPSRLGMSAFGYLTHFEIARNDHWDVELLLGST